MLTVLAYTTYTGRACSVQIYSAAAVAGSERCHIPVHGDGSELVPIHTGDASHEFFGSSRRSRLLFLLEMPGP